MKTFLDSDNRQEILSRLQKLTPTSERRWGTMTPHQMVCHLADSTRVALGLLPVRSLSNILTRSRLFRIMAFNPLPWPHGLKTAPEIDQTVGGTPPAVFEADLRELMRLLDAFIADTRTNWPDHPIMGSFSRKDWGKQMYRHCDHHLKQFGV